MEKLTLSKLAIMNFNATSSAWLIARRETLLGTSAGGNASANAAMQILQFV